MSRASQMRHGLGNAGLRIFYPRRFALRFRLPRRFAFADGRVGRFSKTSRDKIRVHAGARCTASAVPGYRNSISSPRNKGFCNLVSCDVEPRCCDQDLHYVTNRSPCLDRAAQQRCCERRYPAEATDASPIVSGIILRWSGRLRRSIRCESTRERWKTGR